MIRYVQAKGDTIAEMRDNARESELYQHGDMKLVWANEGDLSMQDIGPLTARCPECGMTGPCMWSECFHPLARPEQNENET